MRASFVLLFLVLILSACASKPPGTERVFFPTVSPRWLDEVGAPDLATIKGRGYLVLPQGAGPGPYPAVILLHSSLGVGTLEWDFTDKLLAQGMAVLLVDSFTGRGLTKIEHDQMEVSEVSILADLYAGYRFLVAQPQIDRSRVAVAGFSKGGLPAVYSAFTEIYQRYGYQNDPFQSHLAFYPWCGLRLKDWRMSGRPVQIHSGDADKITPAALCRQLVQSAWAANPGASVSLIVYPGQRHGFTHPDLDEISLPVSYPYPRDCRIVERADGRFVEQASGRVITGDNLSEVIGACSAKGAWVSGDEGARTEAYKRALAFLLHPYGSK
ncbi:MAG: dienelactone hydrolase family protein [Alphaproteobacteria bacterium]|nr:dienelactone hydrolase family protein [Alphaproteobacteria bacterium]